MQVIYTQNGSCSSCAIAMSTEETNWSSLSDESPIPFSGLLFASPKQSALQKIDQLWAYHQSNNNFTTTAPPTPCISEPPYTFFENENNIIVSPSIVSNLNEDNVEYQNMAASLLTPRSIGGTHTTTTTTTANSCVSTAIYGWYYPIWW